MKRPGLAAFFGLALLLIQTAAFGQICDPPGPPPRFGCSWSIDTCEWVCAICDPFGVPPRDTCNWDSNLCNWVCPGYTGVEVTVETTQPPDHTATVYVRLSSLCTVTGASAMCGGNFDVHPGWKLDQKCQAIADAITNNCSSAGYAVTRNDCQRSARFTASNVGCPATPFALGLSNDPAIFDQAGLGPLPDGESENTRGSPAACALTPGPVSNLQLVEVNGGADLRLTWDDTTNADDYIVFSDTAPNGTFDNVVGTAASGASGLTIGMPAGSDFYLVAARNSACGLGPKH